MLPPACMLLASECHVIEWVIDGIALMVFSYLSFLLSDVEPSADRPVLRDQECVCEGGVCEQEQRCIGQHCFSSLKVIDGAAGQQKGCLRDDEEGRAVCATPPSPLYAVKCCQGHLCNMNVTVHPPGKGNCTLLRWLPLIIGLMALGIRQKFHLELNY